LGAGDLLKLRWIVALLLFTGACAGAPEQAVPTATSTAGESSLEAAHDFTLSTFAGDTFTLSDHFGELPVVLNFWAPW